MAQRFLEGAEGYAVYASDGRRVGRVIGLVTDAEERGDLLAIRCEGTFLSKRRIVPVAAVASVNPQEQNVTLLLDAANIERAHELQTEEIRPGWVAERIAHYADPPGATADTHEPDADAVPVIQHVLFAPTAAGYVLIERDGAAPSRAATVELSDPPGRFAVVKLAQSPLPHDLRLCAYLDRLE